MPVDFDSCCGFVTDLKNAAVLIALLAILTNPLVSWVLVRHTYAVRASCLVTIDKTNPDTLDVNAENFLNIGFGGAAGAGVSCLSMETYAVGNESAGNQTEPSDMVRAAKYLGWLVTFADLVFLVAGLYFLFSIFGDADSTAAGIFMWACAVTALLSFIYGMIYVHVCITIGHAFPVFEFCFSITDLILWVYFILVVMAYRQSQ